MALLKVSNVSKSYDGRKIIDNINLELNKGEIVSLLGVSGVGKTTLFQVISGLVKPDNGTVELNGKNITGISGEVGYMLQKDLLVQYKTVLDNVALPLVIRGEKKKVAREKVSQLFPKFGLDGTQNKYPSQLSGGMRQLGLYIYFPAPGGRVNDTWHCRHGGDKLWKNLVGSFPVVVKNDDSSTCPLRRMFRGVVCRKSEPFD